MPQDDLPSIPPCYCIAWRRAANALTQFYDQGLAAVGLTITQYSLLKNIGRLGACNKTRLAEVCRLERSTVVRDVAVLEKRGFVENAPEATSRNKVIRLSAEGQAIVGRGQAVWREKQEAVERVIGRENLPAFRRLIAGLEALSRS